VGAPRRWNVAASPPPSRLTADNPFPVTFVPCDHARCLPRASPVLTDNTLSLASCHRVASERATASSRAQTACSDHATSAPGACATSSCHGSFSPLDRATRPKPMRLFGLPCMAARRVARAVARAGLRPNTMRDLKKSFPNCLNSQKIFQALKINRNP
jgi:hypothetical protein